MPVLTAAGPTGIADLAQKLADDLSSGRVARQSFGQRDVAFQWAAGLPNTLARQVTNGVVEGLRFGAVRIAPSGTPAGKVAAGAQKPAATSVTSDDIPLSKYAGIASWQTEQALTTEGLTAALAAVITSSCLLAFDADCAAALAADAGLTAGGTTWPAAILDGIGEVAAAGGAPSLLVLSPADYAAAVQSPGVGYASNPADGAVSLFGLKIVLSPSLATGTAYVADETALMAVENADSPLAVVDPFSGLGTNEIRLAVELFAAFVVVSPGGVAEVTVTVAGE